MNKQLYGIAGGMLIIGGLAGYNIAHTTPSRQYFEGNQNYQPSNSIPNNMHMMHDGTMMMNNGAATNTMMGMHMSVTSEEEFVRLMIPHHEEAVRTATEVLERGSTNTAVQALAKNIVESQTKEINMMRTWYKNWYGKEYTEDKSYTPMMRNLSKLSGTDLDKVFLEDMIMHHMGALMMAKSVQPYITHRELATLTSNITTSQSAEIDEMKRLLK